MIDPGSLNERVQLLAPTISYGANGEPLHTWGDYGTRWALVEPLTGTETVQADILMPATRIKVTLRYESSYTENYRLVWNSQTWNVISISILGKKEYIEILAESNTSQTGDSTDYGDYYATNSLKIRQITASAVTTVTPTQAELNSDIGLTAVTAGGGYMCMIHIAALNRNILVESNGTNWYISYVGIGPQLPYFDASSVSSATPSTAQVSSDLGFTPAAGGAGYAGCINYNGAVYLFISNGTHWSQFNETRTTS